MDVTLTVVATATGSTADVQVVSPDTAPATAMLRAMCAAVGATPGAGFTIAGRPVPTDGLTADCGFIDGAVVHIGESLEPLRPTPLQALIEIAVVSGPDAGRRLALTEGEHVVGRDPQCQLPIDDASISRRHLLIRVASDTVTVNDLDSANGTAVNAAPLLPQHVVPLAVGDSLRLGDSEVRLVIPPAASAAIPSLGGHIGVHRAPRLQAPAPVVDLEFPIAVPPPPPTRVPVLAAIAPLIAGVVLSVVLHQWQFLAFTALSPIMILGQAASDRRSSRRSSRLADRDHTAAIAAVRHRLLKALAAERLRRHRDAPDLATLTGAASRRAAPLWQRASDDADAIVLRLGRGNMRSEVRLTGTAEDATVTDVPICVAMRETAVLGVCGPRELTLGLARSLVVQAASLHSPAQLRLVLLAPGNVADWGWVRWLPHVAGQAGEDCVARVGFDADQVSTRVGELGVTITRSASCAPHTLVIVDGTATTRRSAALAALLASAGSNLSFIWCAEREGELPGTCRAIAALNATPAPRLLLTRSGRSEDTTVIPDLLAADLAEATARALAPLRDDSSSDSGGVPTAVRWENVAGVDLGSHELAVQSLARTWLRGPSTDVSLGGGTNGTVTVDLCRDGPHALVAGTTGSGKSELLLSLVASLVAANRPDQLSLLLIDHKGGAAFGSCARLPHTVGVVTDLDGESTRRALRSLSAELRRRETLFATAAVTDLESYDEARRDSSERLEPMARLVIVVDEFATLAEEQPDFVGGLVGIAQRGRSLGVHLVLATQRPDGVVSADIRANTRLRICLGVAREAESRDVIDCPDAASISRRSPGRAYLRVGPGDLRMFQVARIAGSRTERRDVLVTLSPAATLGDPPPLPVTDSSSDTDLDVLIAAAREVSTTMGCQLPPAPWLPPLGDSIALSTLARDPDSRQVPWALLDLPTVGAQRPLHADLRHGGTTLIAGTARSGRTTAARALALSAAARRSPDQLHLWAIDASAGLLDLADLAHCGGVIPADDVDRIERLLGHLTEEIARRRHFPVAEQPALMLLLDSWDGLAAALDGRDGGRLVDAMLRLAADGPAANLHLVITTDRGGMVGRLAGVASEKIVLRLSDPGDFALVGMPGRDVPCHLPPGRGVRAGDLSLLQVAMPDDAIIAEAGSWPAPRHRARQFDPLPHRVLLSDLQQAVDCRDGRLVLGQGIDDLAPVTIARHELGASYLIVGPPGSGRSTALLLLAQQRSGRPVAVCGGRRSPLLEHVGAIQLPRDDQDHAAALLDSLCASDVPPDILIDDVDLIGEGPLWSRLEELIRNPADDQQIVAMSGSIEATSTAFRGPIAQARRAKTGVLLGVCGPHDGALFGIRLPRRTGTDEPPGRGWLARRGTATRLQLADPSSAEAAVAAAQPRTLLELSGFGERCRE
jgi:S-DNA-T family DNA segregation ATPase FtsK/SpoIIIE